MFVDLSKAYDSVDRGRLFDTLVTDLGVDAAIVKALVLMYTDVTQQIVVDGELSRPFRVTRGVR